ncbi:MAG: ImmA/IrrE family metallo-endopeptidase [Clostridium sp.]|nr:ImmA/IrrE family metallo-endopeptidase [Clostridium sp.]
MDYRTREFINELAEAVIDYYQIPTPITDIDAVVSRIGGTIVTTMTTPSLSGGSISKKGESFEMCVDPFQTLERRNFTIAHELGHLFIHMGYNIDDEIWEEQDERPYYRYGNTEMEYQANEFAGALLMPKDEYLKVMNRHTHGNIVDTAKIAEHFHVSVDAAANRGKWLGYLAW